MNSNQIEEKTYPLYVQDPDLPFLASKAAIELDNLLLGRNSELRSLSDLANKLKKSFLVDRPNGHSRSLIDPATLNMIGEAINISGGSSRITSTDQLIEEAIKIASDLTREINPIDNKGELELARDFCLALSRLASAYHKNLFDMKPVHPLRKLR